MDLNVTCLSVCYACLVFHPLCIQSPGKELILILSFFAFGYFFLWIVCAYELRSNWAHKNKVKQTQKRYYLTSITHAISYTESFAMSFDTNSMDYLNPPKINTIVNRNTQSITLRLNTGFSIRYLDRFYFFFSNSRSIEFVCWKCQFIYVFARMDCLNRKKKYAQIVWY